VLELEWLWKDLKLMCYFNTKRFPQTDVLKVPSTANDAMLWVVLKLEEVGSLGVCPLGLYLVPGVLLHASLCFLLARR
jgi:hypothetical protein